MIQEQFSTGAGRVIRRGVIWTVSGGYGYGGKPRPAVIVQDDTFDETQSIVICSFTTNDTAAPLYRPELEPNQRNGLRASRRIMVDKIASVPKARLGACIGRLDDQDLLRLNRAIVVFLGLAASSRARLET
jgi:mRNA interferase MazF